MRKAFLQFPKALFAWCTINSCCDYKCLMHSGGTEWVGLRAVSQSHWQKTYQEELSFSPELSLFKRNILQPYTNVWNHKQAANQGDGKTGQLLLLWNIVKSPNLLLVKLENMWQSVCTSPKCSSGCGPDYKHYIWRHLSPQHSLKPGFATGFSTSAWNKLNAELI